MEENCDYVIENGILYKDCPSCNSRCENKIYYECPQYFGYRGEIIQSSCIKCRGRISQGMEPLEGYRKFPKEDYIHIKEIRILPMSEEGMQPCKTIEEFFFGEMPSRNNLYYYKKNKMNINRGTLVLFQYKAGIIGYGLYEYSLDNIVDKELLDSGYKGFYKFFDNSIIILEQPVLNKTLKETVGISLNQTLQKVSLSKFPRIFELMNLKGNSIKVNKNIIEQEYGLKEENLKDKKIKLVDKFSILGMHNIVKSNKETQLGIEEYNKIQEAKSNIGNIGEKLVLDFEREKLKKYGLNKLAENIRQVSLEDSSLGYDIVSYNEHGDEIYIEVKSKASNINYIDFYLTDNEYEKLSENNRNYIYYVSKLRSKEPKLFILNKDSISDENLKVILYKVSLDYKED